MDSVAAALHAIRVQRISADVALWSILAAPLLALAVIRWLADRKPRWHQGTVYITGCFTVVCYGSIALFFAMCAGGEIGESGKNRLAKAYGEPVIAALARYHADSASYPFALPQLVPLYLSAEALRAPELPPLCYPFEYRGAGETYQLSARYVGPGMNECRYAPAAGWSCDGHF